MLRKITHTLHHHFSHDAVWHRTGAYAALLAGVLYACAWWPVDPEYWSALIDHPHVFGFSTGMLQFTWCMVVLCALVGLQRKSWLDRAGAVVALYRAQAEFGWIFLGHWDYSPLQAAYHGAFEFLVVLPFNTALHAANDLSGVAAGLVAVYLGLWWIAVRLIAGWSAPRIARILRRRGAVAHA